MTIEWTPLRSNVALLSGHTATCLYVRHHDYETDISLQHLTVKWTSFRHHDYENERLLDHLTVKCVSVRHHDYGMDFSVRPQKHELDFC